MDKFEGDTDSEDEYVETESEEEGTMGNQKVV